MASSVLDEVRSNVAALEAQCHALGPMVDRCDWKGFERLLSEMARARHGLANAWEASAAERSAEFEEEIRTRVQRILEYRAYQLRRLEQFRDHTGERLQLISRWRTYARSVVGKRQKAPSIFSDVR